MHTVAIFMEGTVAGAAVCRVAVAFALRKKN